MANKIDSRGIGIAAGLIAGVSVLTITLLSVWTGYATDALKIYASFHPFYTISIAGAFLGLIYSFICWFVMGYIFGQIYNKFQKRNKN